MDIKENIYYIVTISKSEYEGDMYESNKKIAAMALSASRKAVRSAKAHKVPITYLSGTDVITENPDGSKIFIEKIPMNQHISQQRRFNI